MNTQNQNQNQIQNSDQDQGLIKLNKFNTMFLNNTLYILKHVVDNCSVRDSNLVKNSEKFIDVLKTNSLSIAKITEMIQKVYTVVGANIDNLRKKDPIIFNLISNNKKITIIPGIDLGYYFKLTTTTEDNKEEIWRYMYALFYSSVKLLVLTNHEVSPEATKFITEQVMNIDPFEGLLGGEITVAGITDDLNSMPKQDMMQMMMSSVIGKLNIGDLSEQLGNISSDKLNDATGHIMKLLTGGDTDPHMENTLKVMMNEVQKEFNATNFKNNKNPIDSIMNIAEKIANNMKTSIDPNTINVEKLLSNTTNMAQNLKDEHGNPILGANNPLSMLQKMMENKMNISK